MGDHDADAGAPVPGSCLGTAVPGGDGERVARSPPRQALGFRFDRLAVPDGVECKEAVRLTYLVLFGPSVGLLLACTRGRPPEVPFPGELAETLAEDAATRNLVYRTVGAPLWLQRSGVGFECEQVSCGAQPCETRCRSSSEQRRDVRRAVRATRKEFGREQSREGNKWCWRSWAWSWRQEEAVADERYGLLTVESHVCDAKSAGGLELRIQLGSTSREQRSTCPCER